MSIKRIALVLFGLLMLVLAACGPGTHAIVASGALGTTSLDDHLYSGEPRTNNSITWWMQYDDVDSWCTFDPVLAAKVNAIRDSGDHKVRVFYRSINNDDAEQQHTAGIGGDGCATEKTGVTVYKLLDIKILRASYYPGATKLPDSDFLYGAVANIFNPMTPVPQ